MGVIRDICKSIDMASARLGYGTETKDLLLFVRPDMLKAIIAELPDYTVGNPFQPMFSNGNEEPCFEFAGIPLYVTDNLPEQYMLCLRLEGDKK